MGKRLVAVAIVAIVLTTLAVAEEQPVEDRAAKRADSHRLLEVTHAQDRARVATQVFIPAFRKLYPSVPEKLWGEVASAAADEAVDIRSEVQEKYLTHAEIKALIEFYATPLGQKLLEVEGATEAEANNPERRARLLERMKETLRASGYDLTTPRSTVGPMRVGGEIREPKKVKQVNPDYPEAAREAGIQGVVILECTISPEGIVTDVKILHGIPALDEAAVKAVKQWVYTPTVLNGVQVPVIMTVTVNFRLGPSAVAPPRR